MTHGVSFNVGLALNPRFLFRLIRRLDACARVSLAAFEEQQKLRLADVFLR
jgi:hypothetical protein